MPRINYDELPPDAQRAVRKAAGRKRITRARTFTRELERSHALRILAELATLTQDQRRRVLQLALKVNAV